MGARLLLQSYEYPNLSEGADRVGGQLRGDKECPSLKWRSQIWQSLEEGAGKQCSECVRRTYPVNLTVLLYKPESSTPKNNYGALPGVETEGTPGLTQ